MKIIWTFTLLMIPGVLSSISVTGYSGGGVSITCRYDRRYTDNNKYFCKGQWSGCKDQIRTTTKNKRVDSGRFSLYDDTSAAVFTVTIRDLSEQDSDIYYCGTDIYAKYDPKTEVKLNVVAAADCCQKSISLSAAAGGSVNISCRYPQSHSADVKFVCRRSGSDLCAEETSVKESRRWSAEGQMQLYDDREQQLLTGIISHVTQQHSAEYWCGVQSDPGHKSFIARVLINVTDANSHRISTSPSSSPSSSSSSSSLSSSSGDSPLVSSVSPITGSLLIISVSVLLLLIFTVILIVTVTLWRRRQSHNAHSSSHCTPANIDAAAHYHCDYEETEDSYRQLPTNPSDSTNAIYVNPEFPTVPSDSTNTIYATPE
ncbi:polymeric immunoglobulin receptor isoform X9 [Carassius gibelio]|uniref:polymeric immunoglobulin receptor isoform X9 n=1 Tax=Carassius gibelio TaxID=101364 RepID=UPI002278F98E|nr:polymeric immunoglobulin receptor isoform X9 [Carassius gibelio]